MQYLINRDNTMIPWEDCRIDLGEGAVMPPDRDIMDLIMISRDEVYGTVSIVERGDRHLIVRITYPKLDI
jgi:hypothetical protein